MDAGVVSGTLHPAPVAGSGERFSCLSKAGAGKVSAILRVTAGDPTPSFSNLLDAPRADVGDRRSLLPED